MVSEFSSKVVFVVVIIIIISVDLAYSGNNGIIENTGSN